MSTFKTTSKVKNSHQLDHDNMLISNPWEPNVIHPTLFRIDVPKQPILPSKVDALFPLINFLMQPTGPSIPILVKSVGDNDEGIAYNIGLGVTMKVIYEDYARRLDRSSAELNIFFKGAIVHSWHTPLAVGLTGNDVLYVTSENGLMNLNTHVKVFSIEEMRTNPKTLYYKADKLLRCAYLFEAWADVVEVDPSRVYLICENTVLSEYRTVEDMKIKNGDRILAYIEPN